MFLQTQVVMLLFVVSNKKKSDLPYHFLVPHRIFRPPLNQPAQQAFPREVSLESWDKKKKMNDGGGGGERRNSSPLPLQPFFCFRSNFRAITRLETLATQATPGSATGVPFDSYPFSTNIHKQILLSDLHTFH